MPGHTFLFTLPPIPVLTLFHSFTAPHPMMCPPSCLAVIWQINGISAAISRLLPAATEMILSARDPTEITEKKVVKVVATVAAAGITVIYLLARIIDRFCGISRSSCKSPSFVICASAKRI